MATKNLQYESGRSMVEMLGTLAIIGVLSIGGIAGYSYGMDKYRANQTINDVMLRAVDIITQISQGKEPNLEPEWGTKGTVYDMEEIHDETNNTWGIVVDGVPSRVCQMVGDALKTQATVYVGNVERNDTTASDPCESSDSNSMEFYFEPIETTFECDPECGTGEFCRWGECVSEKIEYTKWPTDSACSSDTDCEPCGYCVYASDGSRVCDPRNGQNCTINTANDGICHWGECLPKGCSDTNPCKEDKEYCASPNTYTTSNCKAFYDNEEGTCVKADFKPITVGNKEYWVSNTTISWWDADAACKALGKSLLSLDDLLTDWDETAYRNGTKYTFTRNELAKELYTNVFGGTGDPYIWTSDDYDSCNAFLVNLYYGSVYHPYRNYNFYHSFAVCQ